MTENELRALRWFAQERKFITAPSMSIKWALVKELGLDKDECQAIINSLYTEGLISVRPDMLNTVMSYAHIYGKRTTPAGDQLLATLES